MDTTNTRDTSFEPAFYMVDNLNMVALREGIGARFISGNRLMFSFVHLAPGAIMPEHSHPHEQLGYILQGSMSLTIDTDERSLHPGEAYAIPGGVPHKAVAGPDGCVVLDAFNPPREDYLVYAQTASAEKQP